VFGERFALLGAWLFVIVVFGFLLPDTFLTLANFQTIFGTQAILVMLVMGLLLPLTAGEFDLSVASVMSLSAMVTVLLNVRAGWPIGAAILAAILMGAAIGWCNGAMIVRFGVDSFIVTLGTSTVLLGVLQWVSDFRSVSGVSSILIDAVVTDRLFGISPMFYYGLVLTVIIWLLLEHSPVGLRLLFVGRGRNVALLSGMRVGRLRWGALIASSSIAAGAGVCLAGLAGGADPSSGLSFLLPAFAAAFLGATTIRPGRFNAWGTFAAVYFLVTGITGFQLLGVSSYVQNLFYGGALIVAVLLSRFVAHNRGAAGRSTREG
jgi:ribose transport system permease protein